MYSEGVLRSAVLTSERAVIVFRRGLAARSCGCKVVANCGGVLPTTTWWTLKVREPGGAAASGLAHWRLCSNYRRNHSPLPPTGSMPAYWRNVSVC